MANSLSTSATVSEIRVSRGETIQSRRRRPHVYLLVHEREGEGERQ